MNQIMSQIWKVKLVLGLILLAFHGNAIAQTPNCIWAKRIGGTDITRGNSIAVDAFGNVYTVGHLEGSADMDPGSGITNLTSAGSIDIFTSKLNHNGDFSWAKRIGGTSAEEGYDITTDKTGNIYITGFFTGTVDFDPGANTYNLSCTVASSDIFILKLDSNGTFGWAIKMGGGAIQGRLFYCG